MMKCQRSVMSAVCAVAAIVLAFQPMLSKAQAPASTAGQSAAPVLEAKIVSKINTKNAQVGDTVAAKTLRPFKLSDGTELPKGTRLVAKVTSVQSKQAGNGNSLLSFRFDAAEGKSGEIPVHALIVALGPSLAPEPGLGGNSVLSRNVNSQPGTGVTAAGQGTGSSSGMDPSLGLGKKGSKDEDDIPMGSTLEGVALGRHTDADWTTALQGVHRDIQLDGDVVIKLEFK